MQDWSIVAAAVASACARGGARADARAVSRQYADFTVKHFHEQLSKRHGYKLGYTVTKLNLQQAGLVQPRRSARRIARSGRGGRCWA